MHLIAKFGDAEAVKHAQLSRPLGPGFPLELAEQAQKLEIWGTTFEDSSPDKTVFRLYNEQAELIGEREMAGY